MLLILKKLKILSRPMAK